MPEAKSYLKFQQQKQDPKKLTQEYLVLSASSPTLLGHIRWYGSWRKYCFYFEPNNPSMIIFDSVCLGEIISFIDKLMAQRKSL